jgi:hydroxyethylthiazole kinase-like uncharacterized protein yjeF
MNKTISFLSQKEAQNLDQDLMNIEGFSIDQLMELAGLSVACAISKVYSINKYSKTFVICGPGNNGGDGLVASRHLKHFGYQPTIFYPKKIEKPLYENLVKQCKSLNIPFIENFPNNLDSDYNLIIDAIFGFSFKGNIREPFDNIIKNLKLSKLPIVSVDIPSGWDVEEGNINNIGIEPEMLVSLSVPKLCAKKFNGPYHFLGGRFISPYILEKFKLNLPLYPGSEMCVEIKTKY